VRFYRVIWWRKRKFSYLLSFFLVLGVIFWFFGAGGDNFPFVKVSITAGSAASFNQSINLIPFHSVVASTCPHSAPQAL